MIRSANKHDSQVIASIYNHYIANTFITFETEQVHSDEIYSRIQEAHKLKLPFLVYVHENQVVGYAYASKWKGRCAYRFTAEVTVYLDPKTIRKSYGLSLYQELFSRLKQLDYHTAIGGISLPNLASVALHEKMGMTKVAHFKETGNKFDQWIDVGYWPKIL
ncbi:GNAT family N-acetyltransferase [Kangiella sp. HZ709]|uniref:GNAT family N-acetyltransferase n=1 Tax=Kangiella sp. HZ709 TaxID=2666328 RepID=UPI0012AFF603|nr:GNAT family N-acetyltransferase [Kangiella sp. HZ709]MRX28338.1 GNAT family N-acetyltransferase [Kangiella sp. HZ709]